MPHNEAKVSNDGTELKVTLPLTNPTGKVRVKERSSFNCYGIPVAGRTQSIGLSNYVEWQIGYDLIAKAENESRTSLQGLTFVNYKKEHKYVYELSELLFYSAQRKLITPNQIVKVFHEIVAVDESETLEKRDDMQICRTNPQEANVNGVDFYRMTVKYPMLVHRFGQYDIYAEVVVKEKQYAVGTQAMLYLCLPVTSLRFANNVIGRPLDAKESADWVVGKVEAALSLELFRVFGMLSPKHRFDVLAIFRILFPELCA